MNTKQISNLFLNIEEDDFDNKPRLTKISLLHPTLQTPQNHLVQAKTKNLHTITKNTDLAKFKMRPMTTTDITTTHTTLPKSMKSLNSMSTRRPLKSQETLADTSIILDFISDSEKNNNSLQNKISIRPARKLHTQFFYNSVYDVRQTQSPLESKIHKLDKVYKAKAEDSLWSKPSQTMVKGMLETFAKTQPQGAISQLLKNEKEKEEMRRTMRKNMRPSTEGQMRRPKTVEGFFREKISENNEISHIMRSPKNYKGLPSHINKDVGKNIEEYASTLGNIQVLLEDEEDFEIYNNMGEFLEDTPDKRNKQAFEKWNEGSIRKEEESEGLERKREEDIQKNERKYEEILINDYANMDTDDSGKKHVKIFEFPGRGSNTTTNSKSKSMVFDEFAKKGNGLSLQNSQSDPRKKTFALIRKKSNTPIASIRDKFLKKAASMNTLLLEGKKAMPEMFTANIDTDYFPKSKATRDIAVETAPFTLTPKSNQEPTHPLSPGNWILQGTVLNKPNGTNGEVQEISKDSFKRKGHIPKVRLTSGKNKQLLAAMKAGQNENEGVKIIKGGPIQRLKMENLRPNESPNYLLNAWTNGDDNNNIPSFRINAAGNVEEVRLTPENGVAV